MTPPESLPTTLADAVALERLLASPFVHPCRKAYAKGAALGRAAGAQVATLQERTKWSRLRRRVPSPANAQGGEVALRKLWTAQLSIDSLAGEEASAALRTAVALGALETAEILAEWLWSHRRELPSELLVLAVPDLIHAWCATGAVRQALDLVEELAGSLHDSRYHADVLRAGLDGCPVESLLLPGRLPNSFAISELMLRGKISREVLFESLLQAKSSFVYEPQLELLVAGAYRVLEPSSPTAALRALNRVLRFYGLPPLSQEGSAASPLSSLRLATPASRSPAEGRLVSVLVSAFNAEKTITYAIDSLLNQTHQALEVLVGDDCSSDRTLDILKERYSGNDRLKIFASASNQGPYNVRNALLPHARGEFVTFHDADDYAMPTRIAQQLSAMHATRARACIADWVRMTPHGGIVFFRDLRAVRLCMPSLLLERQLTVGQGPFRRARIGADWEFYQRLQVELGSGAIARVRKPLVLSLWDHTSLTRESGGESLANGFKSPRRRAYSEVCARWRILGSEVADDAAFTDVLSKTDNLCEPATVERIR